MQAAIEAIVIQGGVPRRPHLSSALAAMGWSVRECSAVGGLGNLVDARPPQVMMLEGPAQMLCTLAGIARFTAPRAALIVLADDTELEARVLALGAGADVACPLQIDLRELAALGRALAQPRRDDVRPAAPVTPGWHLISGGRVLAGPRGQRLPLTFTESAFFLRLLGAPGHRLPREQLAASRNARGSHSVRSVDVMVSRLRSKAQRLGIELPLLAVRQWGYIFLADSATGHVDAAAAMAADWPGGMP
ncbi:response regulator transcription factor [Bordetella petrii]|uniref:Transcriptional regulator n=1 Tax=Bordetella petrii (strain ATCC BAA-461 / DSM 12804 / CCUG 43448 / CIP 107267 / Se-1111R) TaxID=340100 RepID=A9IFG3_BORPD|nr:response regulator transcription factor [Bordetella petrii]CAP45032.1 putative transcriptional regulator [Bordetella petrii]